MPVTIPKFKVGQIPRLSASFADQDGVPGDPTTVVFEVTEPDEDATVTTYTYPGDAEVVRDGAGEYHVDFEIVHAGEHCYSFKGTGVLKAFNSDKFEAVGACA